MKIEIQSRGSYMTLKFDSPIPVFGVAEAKLLHEQASRIDGSDLKKIKSCVIDLENVKSFHPGCVPWLCRISTFMDQFELKTVALGEAKLNDLIIKNGISRMISFYSNLDKFHSSQGVYDKENIKLFLNTLIDSVLMAMNVLLEAEVKSTKTQLVTDVNTIPKIQAGAMAGIISTHFNGNIVIGFSNEVFLKVMSSFLQMEVFEISSDIKDGAAELLNVIIGQTKIKLNEKGFEMRQVIPNVITGQDVVVSPMAKQSALLISCDSSLGEFFILLSTNAKM